MRQANINKCFTIGIIIAVCLGLFAFVRLSKSKESMTLLMSEQKQNYDNSDVWKINTHSDTNTLQFIYQGNLAGDGDKVVAMTLTKDGVLTVNRGFSFAKPINRSWLITPDTNNALILGNKQNGGLKLDSEGAVMPLKYIGGGRGGPVNLSKICMKDDGTSTLYGGLCSN